MDAVKRVALRWNPNTGWMTGREARSRPIEDTTAFIGLKASMTTIASQPLDRQEETKELEAVCREPGRVAAGSYGSHLSVVLHQPEIPQNTGNIARTCAATHTPLHLIEPIGFRLTDRYLKRAGLDYWPHVFLRVHPSLDAMREATSPSRLVFFSAHGCRTCYDFHFQPGDWLVFGSETRGLPRALIESDPDRVLKIPIDTARVRSLNLSTTVGVALFEALRQLNIHYQKRFHSRASASVRGAGSEK